MKIFKKKKKKTKHNCHTQHIVELSREATYYAVLAKGVMEHVHDYSKRNKEHFALIFNNFM